MPPEAYACLAVGAVAAVVTFASTFLARRASLRLGAVVMPDERRIHTSPLPYLGGSSVFLGFGAALAAGLTMPPLHPVYFDSSEMAGLALGSFLVFAVGLVDDVVEMSAPAKVAGILAGAMAFYYFGVTMYQFKVPLAGFVILSPSWEPLITGLWVVGIANAVNLIDGLDGLAAGIVAIASASLAVYGLRLESLGYLSTSNLGPVVAAAIAGACVGFLPHNFHPARIIMGDAGALFLGAALAGCTMEIGGRAPEVSGTTYFFFAPIFIPIIILGVPILDVVFAIGRRAISRKGISNPDVGHLHHRLLRLGHGQRRAVSILWLWTALLSAFVLIPTFDPRINAFVPLGVGVFVASLFTWFRPRGREEAREAIRGGA
jgi:UDP-GlcNAc:undecaprenyl-phosphate GlcNAc-1-phosphate transferase